MWFVLGLYVAYLGLQLHRQKNQPPAFEDEPTRSVRFTTIPKPAETTAPAAEPAAPAPAPAPATIKADPQPAAAPTKP